MIIYTIIVYDLLEDCRSLYLYRPNKVNEMYYVKGLEAEKPN